MGRELAAVARAERRRRQRRNRPSADLGQRFQHRLEIPPCRTRFLLTRRLGRRRVLTTQEGDTFSLVKINARTGQAEWTRKVGSGDTPRAAAVKPKNGDERRHQKFHNLQNLASPTPATDGQVVVVHFGNGDLAAYDYAGKQLWKRNLQDDYGAYTIWWGHANSPIIYKDLVIDACMQDSLADLQNTPVESYLVAHDRRTGELKWKTVRKTQAKAEECDAYTTPIVRRVGDHTELVLMGGNQLDGYDPDTGKQLWFLQGLVGNRTITGPTLSDGLVFATCGMRKAARRRQAGKHRRIAGESHRLANGQGHARRPFARGLEGPALSRHRQRLCPVLRREDGRCEMEGTSTRRLQGVAGRGRRAGLFPQSGWFVYGSRGVGQVRTVGGQQPRRRHQRLAGGGQRAHLYSDQQGGAVLHWSEVTARRRLVLQRYSPLPLGERGWG